MILFNKIIVDISLARHLDTENLIKGIKDISYLFNLKSSIPLIKDLRIG